MHLEIVCPIYATLNVFNNNTIFQRVGHSFAEKHISHMGTQCPKYLYERNVSVFAINKFVAW